MQGFFDSLDRDTGELVNSHLPCEDCGSSDALAVYDNNTYCHSCGKWRPKNSEEHIETEFTIGKIGRLEDRKIDKEVCKFYNVSCVLDESNNIVKHIYPYYSDNKRVGQKIRTVADKAFTIEGKISLKSELFGQHLFTSINKKYLIITEGELDAMAAYQMTGGIWGSVSVPLGANAAYNSIKGQMDFCNLFDHVVLCFDNDEQGRAASKTVAKLFETGRCKVLKFPTGIKDACDMNVADKAKEFIQLIYNSESYKPEGIHDLYDLKDAFIKRRKELVNSNILYPFPCLNKATYGIRKSELVIVTAPTGVGKTSFLREVQEHILKTTDEKIGVMYIEEKPEDTFGLTMGLRMNSPIHLPDTELNETALQEAMDKIGRGRVYTYDHFGSTGLDDILYRIRYMKKALGCNVIILDHISMLIDERYDDERRALDNIVYKLKLLSIELDIAILAVSHLNRQGQLRGTAQIEQLANILIMFERDKLNPDDDIRFTSNVIIMKNRFVSREGKVGALTYNPTTHRLEEENGYENKEESNTRKGSDKEIKGEESTRAFTAGSL